MTPLPANAGAWIAPEGGQEIITSAVGERDEVVFYEGGGYWEYRVDERDAVVASQWLEQNYDTQDGWRAEVVLGAKRVFFRSDDTVVAAQAGALWMSHPGEAPCSEGGAQVRLMGGRSFGKTSFVNVEAATHVLEGGCAGERLEVTAGYRPRENWLAMAQLFLDAPRAGEETVRAQLTAVRFGRRGRGLQIGVRARLDGDDPEPTLVLGLWGRASD